MDITQHDRPGALFSSLGRGGKSNTGSRSRSHQHRLSLDQAVACHIFGVFKFIVSTL